MTFNDLMSKTSKQRKTTKIIKLHEFYRLYVQTIKTTQNNESDQITIILHRFDVQTIKNVELRRKPFNTTLNYKSDQNTMTFNDLMSKTSKQRKTAKVMKLQWIGSI